MTQSDSRPTPEATPAESRDQDSTDAPAASARTKQGATIRFFPYQDSPQSPRPSLPFIPLSRTLPSDSCVIRVGRYSERDGHPVANPPGLSDAPVGFKSKVVSRKHCEFLYMNGQWHVKDVGSSSGTFLNHMRLSQPNMASRLYPVKDGDIVQLGIDYRGGEEMIYRCVRIRVECNRAWQRQPNKFNKNTETLIQNLGKGDAANYEGCRECSICLGSVLRPYQCLFMAACAHVWHYKCVSRLIHTPDYPMFQCPNCRAYTDLSAEVDDTNEDEREAVDAPPAAAVAAPADPQPVSTRVTPSPGADPAGDPPAEHPSQNAEIAEADGGSHPTPPPAAGLADTVENMHLHDPEGAPDGGALGPTETAVATPPEPPRSVRSSPATTNTDSVAPALPVDVPGWQTLGPTPSVLACRPAQLRADTPVRSESSDDNVMTPENDSGILALDGRAGMS
ncbi:hypothetical protein BDW42DRAFT_15286 [Aspergillus taichungensis]|uniref:SMAD/FHA domain-containing protein n=1 Tax=Aspergillus taichungensis TaxID=482145 RepID=A0A2J5HI63_9EURO|nr:hypothetical protein BDW42DRAFT_15286 [Aspergillus taichungensis]